MTKDIENVYFEVLKQIVFMKLKPGDRISETKLSQKYSISRTPAREVLKKLEFENLLDIYSKSGCFVSKFDIDSLNNDMFLRASVEFSVMAEVLDKITNDEIKKIKEKLVKQYSLLKQNVYLKKEELANKFFEFDNEFHREIYGIVGKESILDYLNSSFPAFSRYRYLTFYRDEAEIDALYEIHLKMVSCLEQKDYKSLKAIVDLHNYSGLDGIDKVKEKHKDYFKEEDL